MANAPTLAREPPPCMLTHPCVLPHCIAHKLLPRPFGRHGARPRPQARTILAPQQAAVLRDKEEQAASHERALVDQQPGIGALHRLHELDAPFTLMSGRLLSLSVLRFSAHPCNPGTHAETPWRSADALCWLSARRLLDDSRAEDCHDGCRARHGAAWAARGGVERGGAVCSRALGTEVQL